MLEGVKISQPTDQRDIKETSKDINSWINQARLKPKPV